ncbi:MAG: hypothetical protein HKN19_12260 [Halioglobus sp.]|nr:hypothetical protein [Halioglobus sp.]
MNKATLLQAEAQFLSRYPEGFADPGMESIRKKHDIDKIAQFAGESLVRERFNRPEFIVDAVHKIVSRSSMVSRFEKPRFRDFVKSLNSGEREALANAMELRLYGREKRRGFEELVGMLAPHGLAKWSVVSVVPFYFAPKKEAFVKPTTAKGIIEKLEVEGLTYKPQPTWAFYRGYLKLLGEIRKEVAPSLAVNYAALSGFLMSTLKE